MRKRSVVFELTDGEIRAFWFSVHPLSKYGHSSTAVKFDRIPIPTGVIEQGNVRNETVLNDILAAYGAQNPGGSQQVYLAIPLHQGFIRSYTLPWIPKPDRKSAISLLIDEEIPIARTDLLFDYLVLSEEKHLDLQILLGATRRSLLEQYVCIFEGAGFKVVGVDLAFSILGQSLGFEFYQDILYLQGEVDSFQIVLFRGAVPESVRSLNEGPKERENEIRRFLLYYRTQHPDLNVKRLVWKGDCGTELLAQGLLTSNHVSMVEQAKLTNVPHSWQNIVAETKGLGEVAVGYGIRISAQGPKLNLWRQPYMAQTVQRRYRGMAMLIVALFMMGNISWFWLYQSSVPLQKDVQQLSLQGAKIETQAKHQEDLAVAWNKLKINPERIGDALAQIQALQALPGADPKIEQVVYKQGNLSLSGSAIEVNSVENLLRTLRTMGWEQPALSSYKLTSHNNVEFSLSAKRGQVRTNTVTDTSSGEGG